jgi:hypothetical protein
VVGDWNDNGGGTARTEGWDRSERPEGFMQPEFLPEAGDWKTPRYGLWCNDWLVHSLFNDGNSWKRQSIFSYRINNQTGEFCYVFLNFS